MAKSVMVSVDFMPVEEMQKNDLWDQATNVMVNTESQVAPGGADFIVIATNTMYMTYEAVKRAVNIPVLYITDATAFRIMENLVERGAEGIILGCTEISLLVGENDYSVPVFDTTYIHAETLVEIAVGEKSL